MRQFENRCSFYFYFFEPASSSIFAHAHCKHNQELLSARRPALDGAGDLAVGWVVHTFDRLSRFWCTANEAVLDARSQSTEIWNEVFFLFT